MPSISRPHSFELPSTNSSSFCSFLNSFCGSMSFLQDCAWRRRELERVKCRAQRHWNVPSSPLSISMTWSPRNFALTDSWWSHSIWSLKADTCENDIRHDRQHIDDRSMFILDEFQWKLKKKKKQNLTLKYTTHNVCLRFGVAGITYFLFGGLMAPQGV